MWMRFISSFMTFILIAKVKLWSAWPHGHGIGPLTCLLGAKCELLAWERQWVRVNSAYMHCLHDLELIIMTRLQWSGHLTRGQNTHHLVLTQQVSWWSTIQNASFLSLECRAWQLWWSGAEKHVLSSSASWHTQIATNKATHLLLNSIEQHCIESMLRYNLVTIEEI